MTTSEFKKIARLLKEAYVELENEAIKSGVNLLSKEYDELQAKVREAVLQSQGFTLEEYREAKAKVAGFSQADLVDNTEKVGEVLAEANQRMEALESRHIPNEEEIEEIAERIAKKYIKPPQITNQIIERIKEPKIIKETIKVKERVEYNDKPIRREFEGLEKKVKSIPVIDVDSIKSELTSKFQKFLDHNIEVMGMPDFRKLAMGIRADLDTKIEGVYTSKLTVSSTAPSNPRLNDLWYDIS